MGHETLLQIQTDKETHRVFGPFVKLPQCPKRCSMRIEDDLPLMIRFDDDILDT